MIEITKKNIRVWSMLGMRRILGPAMKDIIEQDRKVLFATADTGRYYAYDDLLRTYPENVVDGGIVDVFGFEKLVGVFKDTALFFQLFILCCRHVLTAF